MIITASTPGSQHVRVSRDGVWLYCTELDLGNKRLVRVEFDVDGKVKMTASLGDPNRAIAFIHEDATGVRVVGLNHIDPSLPEDVVL